MFMLHSTEMGTERTWKFVRLDTMAMANNKFHCVMFDENGPLAQIWATVELGNRQNIHSTGTQTSRIIPPFNLRLWSIQFPRKAILVTETPLSAFSRIYRFSFSRSRFVRRSVFWYHVSRSSLSFAGLASISWTFTICSWGRYSYDCSSAWHFFSLVFLCVCVMRTNVAFVMWNKSTTHFNGARKNLLNTRPKKSCTHRNKNNLDINMWWLSSLSLFSLSLSLSFNAQCFCFE